MGNTLLHTHAVPRAHPLSPHRLSLLAAAVLGVLTAFGLVRGVGAAPGAAPAVVAVDVCFAQVVGGSTYSSPDVSAIQTAVEAAAAGATINVAGTCAGVLNRNGSDQSVYLTQTVTFQGGYNPADWSHDPATYPTTLDALGLGRVVYLSAPAADIVLADLILQGGDSSSGPGGGIYNQSASLTLIDSLILDNHTDDSGGGVYNDYSALTLDNTTVLSNTAGYDGAGIYSAASLVGVSASAPACLSAAQAAELEALSSVTLQNGSELIGNTAGGEGGGLYGSNSLLLVDDSLVQFNEAINGGGIYNEGYQGCQLPLATGAALDAEPFEDALLTVSGDSLIDSNLAFPDEGGGELAPGYITGMGGGIFNYQAAAIVLDSTLSNNLAVFSGGGAASVQGQFVISATDVVSNLTIFLGGGLSTSLSGFVVNGPTGPTSPDCLATQAADVLGPSGLAVIGGSEVRDNLAVLYGGGVANDNTLVVVDDSLVTGNQALNGGGLYNHEAYCYLPNAGDYEGFVAAMTIQNGSVVSGNAATFDWQDPNVPNAFVPDPSLILQSALGGGVFNGANTLAVYDSLIQDNTADDDGGGVAGFDSYMVLSATQVLSNTALDGFGGGVFVAYANSDRAADACGLGVSAPDGGFWADLVVRGGSDISHNSADNAGGGLASQGPTILVDESRLTDNRAQLGGGIYHTPDCGFAKPSTPNGGWHAVTIRNASEISGNRANYSDEQPNPDPALTDGVSSFSDLFHGGGVYSEFSLVGVSGSAIHGNTAVNGGGGLFATFSLIDIGDSALYSNTAEAGGGAALLDGVAVITNTTLSANTAENGPGGGLLVAEVEGDPAAPDSADDDVYLGNVTVAYNTATEEGDNLASFSEEFMLRNTLVAGSPSDNCAATINSAGYNLEDGDTCGLVDVTDRTDADAMLAPLAGNGGPTLTHALLRGSPAIDTGFCDFDHDQRGQPRPEEGGEDCDIGAFEFKLYSLWLPVILNTKPDLVGSFTLSPDKTSFAAGEAVAVTVVVTNQGTAATNSGFWVDFNINPANIPDASLPWYDNCGLSPCQGIAWYVDVSLAPGESIVLTSQPGSYAPGHTSWTGSFTPGTTDLYLYVDSWNPTSPTAAVSESNESNNLSELHGLVVAGASVAAQGADAGRYADRWVLPAK